MDILIGVASLWSFIITIGYLVAIWRKREQEETIATISLAIAYFLFFYAVLKDYKLSLLGVGIVLLHSSLLLTAMKRLPKE